MWKSDAQACEAITELLRSVRLERLWTATGPTNKAIELLTTGGGTLSSGEVLMLRVAFDFWNGQGHADFGRMLGVLDNANINAVCGLARALAYGEVDRWLRERRNWRPRKAVLGALLVLLATGCGGAVDSDQEQVREVLPPLSVECVQHEDCLPATLGYATCRDNRCTFRCDDTVRVGEENSNEIECYARGGYCRDLGAGNVFCAVEP